MLLVGIFSCPQKASFACDLLDTIYVYLGFVNLRRTNNFCDA